MLVSFASFLPPDTSWVQPGISSFVRDSDFGMFLVPHSVWRFGRFPTDKDAWASVPSFREFTPELTLDLLAFYRNHRWFKRHRRTSVKYWYKSNKDKKEAGKLLPPQYCNQFANKQIVCVEYDGLNDDAEREIFQVSTRQSLWCSFVAELMGKFRECSLE